MDGGFNKMASTSERLKIAMKEAGKKQADLVRATGIDKGSMSHYVSGRYEPKSDAIYKLAVALDVSEMWLWGFDAPKERPQEQKNNDILADIIVRARTDEQFFEIVKTLYGLDAKKLADIADLLNSVCMLSPAKISSIKTMLQTFTE